jgi:hypothetical protein
MERSADAAKPLCVFVAFEGDLSKDFSSAADMSTGPPELGKQPGSQEIERQPGRKSVSECS